MPQNPPLVDIVILNWNGLEDTLDCLHSLDRLVYPNTQLVVVDNGSANREAERIEAAYPRAVVLRSRENLGYVGGNNCGIRHALAHGADYVWQLNNDTTVAETCLAALVHAAEQRPDVGALCPVIYEHGSEEIQFAGAVLDRQREEHRTLRTLEALEAASQAGSVLLWGTALLLNRKALESVGLLDERYFAYHEDMDYCLRLMAAGFETLVVPHAKVYHKGGRSLGPGQSPVREYLLARNWYLFWRTYLTGRQRRTYPRRYLAWALECTLNAQRAGNTLVAEHILDGAWDALRGHWGPWRTKGRLPWMLRRFLLNGLLAWHPYFWLMLLSGRISDVRREAARRLGWPHISRPCR